MEQVSEIESNHADLIHDVAYDFYGKRSVPPNTRGPSPPLP